MVIVLFVAHRHHREPRRRRCALTNYKIVYITRVYSHVLLQLQYMSTVIYTLCNTCVVRSVPRAPLRAPGGDLSRLSASGGPSPTAGGGSDEMTSSEFWLSLKSYPPFIHPARFNSIYMCVYIYIYIYIYTYIYIYILYESNDTFS